MKGPGCGVEEGPPHAEPMMVVPIKPPRCFQVGTLKRKRLEILLAHWVHRYFDSVEYM